MKTTVGQLKELISESLLVEVKIKARKPSADPDSDAMDVWVGDDRRVIRALARAGVSGVEREHILSGDIPVSSAVLNMLRRDAGLKRDEAPKAPKPYDWDKQRRVQDRKLSSSQNKFNAAVKRFAKNWSHFTKEMPDTAPEDAAGDAAEGFFYEYPKWQEWARALQMSKQDVKSAVADWVYDAMTKGSKGR
jgi:hypothetical protein